MQRPPLNQHSTSARRFKKAQVAVIAENFKRQAGERLRIALTFIEKGMRLNNGN